MQELLRDDFLFHFKFPEEKQIDLIPLGDLHIGAKHSKYKELVKFIESDRVGENTRFVFLGDVIDNAIKNSVADPYDNTMPPTDAIRVFEDEILARLEGKVLGMVSGNHENRTKKQVSFDLLEHTAKKFNIPYDPAFLIIDITLGKRNDGTNRGYNYLICFGHGSGGGRTIGGKANAAKRLGDIASNADLFISGHTHSPLFFKDPVGFVDKRNKNYKVKGVPNLVVPAWLGYEDYARSKFFSPPTFMDVKIQLSGTEKDMTFILK